jgi:hypothetical protein
MGKIAARGLPAAPHAGEGSTCSNFPPGSRATRSQSLLQQKPLLQLRLLLQRSVLFRQRFAGNQNPMDLDYRALGNAGIWCIGCLQTDDDCARVTLGRPLDTDFGIGGDRGVF